MHPRIRRSTLSTLLLSAVWLCSSTFAQPQDPAAFAAHWYQGKAELTSYTLEQSRYGEVHAGHAVLIFVTKDVSREKQVKLDNPRAAGDDAVPVFKLNFTRKFNTGVYPYSMMTSVFSPIDGSRDPAPLKITTSSQEWCGHTFTQLNAIDDGYRVTELSYFESEGDRTLTLDDAFPEDGLWSRIRIDPGSLPLGRVKLTPGTQFQRLRHQAWQSAWAQVTLTEDPDDPARMLYTVAYEDVARTLRIRFDKAPPHGIESWEEAGASGWGPAASKLTTRAVRNKRIMLDYWSRHDVADARFREALGLE